MNWDLPDDWEWTTVGTQAEVAGGLTKNSKERKATGRVVPLVSVAAVGWRQIRPEDFSSIELTTGDGEKGRLKRDDILVVEGNGSLSQIGRVALWDKDIPEARHQNHLIRIRAGARVNPRFLLEWMASPGGRQLLADAATSAAGLYTLNLTRIEKLPLPLPPLPEQRRIVAKLDSLQARTRRARQGLDELAGLADRLRSALLAAAFRGDLTAAWRAEHPDVEPASALLERIRAERRRRWEEANPRKKYVEPEPLDPEGLPEVPEGWGWAAAFEMVDPETEIVYGIVQPGPMIEGGVPYVRGCDIQGGTILVHQLLRTSKEIADRYERASLKTSDVLLGIIRATKVAIVPFGLDGANITQGTARFRPSKFILPEFLAHWLDSRWAQDWLHAHYRGIDMPGLNLKDVRLLPIPVVPLAEQAVVSRRLRTSLAATDRLVAAVAARRADLDALDRALLERAFRGELSSEPRR